MAYTEQITFLLFLKMADEQTRPPYNRKPIVPTELGWASLLKRDGEELERHYRKILDALGDKSGMLGAIFKKARQDIQIPATLRRLIVGLIEPENWSSRLTPKGTSTKACWKRMPQRRLAGRQRESP